MEYIVDMLMEGDIDGAKTSMLLENEQTQVMGKVGDTTLFNYLMKFEEYLDDHDVYLFKGWDEAIVLSPIVIEKYWTKFNLLVPGDTDMNGARRVINNTEGQNKIRVKNLQGKKVVQFQILKKYLDDIEIRNKQKVEDLAKSEEKKI